MFKKGLMLSCGLIISPFLFAGNMGGTLTDFKVVGTLWGGIANIGVTADHPRGFVGTDDNQFIYHAENSSKTTGAVGLFLGTEYQLPHPDFFMQAGVEYSSFLNTQAQGLNWVGIEPLTLYEYSYKIQSQQLLAVAKLFTTSTLTRFPEQRFFPYLSVGIGAAFNNAKDYSASPLESGSLNVTSVFHNQSHSSFSYSLGVGVDTPVSDQVRFGLGYRFSGFGCATLGNGAVVVNQYVYPVSFSLLTPNTYANQLLAQVSYIA